jgi:hypothetical protein
VFSSLRAFPRGFLGAALAFQMHEKIGLRQKKLFGIKASPAA